MKHWTTTNLFRRYLNRLLSRRKPYSPTVEQAMERHPSSTHPILDAIRDAQTKRRDH